MTLDDNSVLRAAREFWQRLPKRSGLPDIRKLNAKAIPRELLPHLIIAQTIGEDFDLSSFRLAGNEITRWFRELPEGMTAEDFARLTDPAYTQHMRDLLAELIRSRRPVYCQSRYLLPGLTPGSPPNVVVAERLTLPMADGGSAVGGVMLVETLTATDFRAGPLRILPPEPGVEVRHGPFEQPV